MSKKLAYLLTPLLLLTAINSLYGVRHYRQLAMNTPQRYNQTGQEVSPQAPIEREQEPVEKTTQTLLIFLDDSEKNRMGAVSQGFLTAFLQESEIYPGGPSAPILVSASVLNNIRNFDPLEEKDLKKPPVRINEITQKQSNKRSQEEEKYERDFFSSVSNFKSVLREQWIIKEINDYLYLLLPKILFLKDPEQMKFFIPQNNDEPGYKPIELLLGLAINHFKTVSEEEIKQPNDQPKDADNYFIQSLPRLFITNKDYYSLDKKNLIPLWNIYIVGHGSIKISIANLSTENFKNFLSFLEQIKTTLLIYVSCYSAGVNAELIYRTQQDALPKTYAFPIITLGLNDIKVYTSTLSYIKAFNKIENLKLNYASFIRHLQSIDQRDYTLIVQNINISNNIPQIKYPGLPWFSVLERERVLPIGSIMGKTRTTPLTIENYYTKKVSPTLPEAVLLYGYLVDFEIRSNNATNDNFPKFISMIPGTTAHDLKKISSDNVYLEKILQAFYIKGLMSTKYFYIHDITGLLSDNMKKILGTDDSSATINKVLIVSFNGRLRAYFVYKEDLYSATEEDIFSVNTIKKNIPDDITYSRDIIINITAGIYHKQSDLTPEKIAKIKAIQEKKITKHRSVSVNDLFAKELSKEIPSDRMLDLSKKGLTSLDGIENMDGLENLMLLKLDDNKLKNLSSHHFSKMKNLRILSLANNNLEVFPPKFLTEGLEELGMLNLLGNSDLKGKYFKPGKYDAKNLEEIREKIRQEEPSVNDLFTKGLSRKIPSNGTLDLSKKGLTSLYGIENMDGIENLRRLELNDNKLENLSSHHFSKMKNLENLLLANNKLKVFPPKLLAEELKQLRWLDLLRNNNLEGKYFKPRIYDATDLEELRKKIRQDLE